jgi:4-amino-4-deoxy-L-arabinose transferase-like glycosyltransferase
MAHKRKKRKKRPPARAASPSRKAAAEARPPRAELLSAPARRWIGLGLDVVLVAVCIVFLAKSARYVTGARFFTDECFHTYVVEQIVATGNSPPRLHALYSGMPNNTHPLFHWLGAALYLVDGRAALPYVNVILCGAMLGLLYWLLRSWTGAAAARIGVSILLLFSVVHVCTQVFYMEILSALTFMLAAFALYVAVGRTDWKLYFLAGVACALALLTKQVGYVLIPVVALCGLYFLVRARWRHVLGIAITAATFAGCFVVGMNALSSKPIERFRTIYGTLERDIVPEPLRIFSAASTETTGPADTAAHSAAGDLQASGGGLSGADGEPPADEEAAPPRFDAKKVLKSSFGRSPVKILAESYDVIGPVGVALLLVCLVHVFVVRPVGATAPLLLVLASLLGAAMLIGTVDKRHFVSAIPVLAACSAIAVSDLLGRVRRHGRLLVLAASGAALVWAGVTVALVPNYRTPILYPPNTDHVLTFRERQWREWQGLGRNAPEQLVAAARAIAEDGPDGAPVLSLWTSSTWYYSGHPATWAGVNVPRLGSVMLNRKPWSAFKPYFWGDIRYFLVDNSRIGTDAQYLASGLVFSETFCRNVIDQLFDGTMTIIYPSREALANRPIWGNREIPYIVVKFDRSAFYRLLMSRRPGAEASDEPPEQ